MYESDIEANSSIIVGNLFLPDHIFLAECGKSLIFLDLRKDSYFLFEAQFAAFLRLRLGLNQLEGACAVDYSDVETAEQLISELIANRILTEDAVAGRRATLLEQMVDIQELPRFGVGGPKIRLYHIAVFLKAVTLAKALLAFGGIERTVNRAAERRRRNSNWSVSQYHEQARELIEIFRKLRPLVMRKRDQCLLSSLILLEFLAAFRIYPGWYFGVRMNEFMAHCWLQSQSIVYNDDVENICDYSIIMAA